MPEIGPSWAKSPLAWGAMINYDLWDDVYTPDDSIALHHGGRSDYPAHNPPFSVLKEEAQLRGWESFHVLSRGWRGIAYGWAIGQTGTVYRLRGWNRWGAHPGDVDNDNISNNEEVIPVVFIGSGHHVGLSPAAEESFVRLRVWLEEQSGRALRLFGHKEVGRNPTSCPGPKLMEYVAENRDLIIDEGGDDDMPTAQEVAQAVWSFPVPQVGSNVHAQLALARAVNLSQATFNLLTVDANTVDEAELDAAVAALIQTLPAVVVAKLAEQLS